MSKLRIAGQDRLRRDVAATGEIRERYERFIKAKYPELPKRRAFFVAQPRSVGGAEDLLVYTYWGERINQDLRAKVANMVVEATQVVLGAAIDAKAHERLINEALQKVGNPGAAATADKN